MSDETKSATDENGKRYTIRVLDPADMLDLLEAAGDLSGNAGWVRYAMMLCSVSEIDGVPVPMPAKKSDVRALAKRIGNAGLKAIDQVLFGAPDTTTTAEVVEAAKN